MANWGTCRASVPRLVAASAAVALLASACGSSTAPVLPPLDDAAIATPDDELADAGPKPTATPLPQPEPAQIDVEFAVGPAPLPNGDRYEQLDLSSPQAAVGALLQSLSDDDYLNTFLIVDAETQLQLARQVQNGLIDGTTLPAFDFTWVDLEDDPAFARTLFNQILGYIAAVDQNNAWLIPINDTNLTIERVQAGEADEEHDTVVDVIVEFAMVDGPTTFRTAQAPSGRWRVVQVVGPGSAVPNAPDHFIVRPGADGSALCDGTVIVFESVDCAAISGLPEDIEVAIEDLRRQVDEGEMNAAAAAQEIQNLAADVTTLESTCRQLQSDARALDRSADATQIASEVIESVANVCPIIGSPDIISGSFDYEAVRSAAYRNVDLSTPESAAAALIDAWKRQDFWTVYALFDGNAQVQISRDTMNFRFEPYYQPPALEVLSLESIDDHSLSEVALFSMWMRDAGAIPGGLTIDLTDASDDVGQAAPLAGFDTVVSTEVVGSGSVTIALEQAPDDRWRVRQLAAPGIDLDPASNEAFVWQ